MPLTNSQKDFFSMPEQGGISLNKINRGLWTEDAFLVDRDDENWRGESFNNIFLGKTLSIKKVRWVLLCILAALFLIWGRVFYLQLSKGSYYSALADSNRIRTHTLEPLRGVIYDFYGNQLVENIPSFALYVVPADLPKDVESRLKIYKEIYKVLAKYNTANLGEERPFLDSIENKIKDLIYISNQPILIQENFGYEEFLLLKIMTQNLQGMTVSVESQRKYLLDGKNGKIWSLSHIFGYLGRISEDEVKRSGENYTRNSFIAKNGLELFYEEKLRGKNGKEVVEVDAIGKPRKIISTDAPEAGDNLMLFLDSELQEAAERILKNKLDAFGLKKGVVVVSDPYTGGILAMVSLPSYDVNLFARGIAQADYDKLLSNPNNPLFFRAVSGEYPSGSTFKPVVAAAALEEKIVTYDTLISSTGGIAIAEWFFPDWKAGGHGLVSVTRAISESVNTFFYMVGGGYPDKFEGLGVTRLKDYALKFGLGSKLGIDIAGEKPGLVPDPEWKEKTKDELWYIGDTYHMAIGQGDLLVTPLQINSFTSVFANGGTLYRPRLASKLMKEEGMDVPVPAEIIRENFIKKENIDIVRSGMRRTITTGTARVLNQLPLSIAGKTGTAQWGTDKKTHAWFTSFAPFEHPKLAVTVLLEEGGEGSDTAVPVAYEIYNWYWQNRITTVR